MNNEEKQVKKWLNRIDAAEKHYKDYHDLIDDTRKAYKNDKNSTQNIFWSSIETLKPFLYFKQPKPYIERREKTTDIIQNQACTILEKALEWDLARFDFDSVIKYARNDFLISGCGILIEKYRPTFEKIKVQNIEEKGGEVGFVTVEQEIKTDEFVETVYVDPKNFLADSQKVGVWEECTWIARKIEMTKREVLKQFGEEFKDEIKDYSSANDEEELKKNTAVYEIWDKKSKTTYYLCKDVKSRFLKISDDTLKIVGFFPVPKPIFATTANDSLIPVPDYKEIKPLLDELDGVTERMKLIQQALKISGAYDNSFPELVNILNKDTSLVSLKDFERLKTNGGIKGIIDFMPIDQYITALQALAERRNDIVQSIYTQTGVSDIMRGNSDPNETATAVTKKTNFGTLRNQDRQNDMQRFLCDLLKIKAEIMCEMFSDETLAQFATINDENVIAGAINLLRQDKMRNMLLGVETDTTFNQAENVEQTLSTIKNINDMITQAFQVVSAQPALLPLYRKMIETSVVALPNARQYEPIIEDTFNKIQQELSQPSNEQPNPEVMKIQLEQQKLQQKTENDRVANQLKANQQQIDIMKLRAETQKDNDDTALKNKEMEYQKDLKELEIATKTDINTNIPAGYVRSFD